MDYAAVRMYSDQFRYDEQQSSSTEQSDTDQSTDQHSDDTWSMKPQVEKFNIRELESGFPRRELGVTWKNLTVEVRSSDSSIHENAVSQCNIPQLIKEKCQKLPLKKILDNTHGCVKPGEMLLVLGRPGSGCTTMLKILANHRHGFAKIEGDVHYGSMTPEEAQQYRGQIVMQAEEELFFPTLTVGQTIDFATRLKVPNHLPTGVESRKAYQQEARTFLLESMGILHTADTKVGNEFVRGVSGGERKRVSIIEALATRGSVFCWDNSTRGLDASTALHYVKAIRAMTDILGLASIVTLYQAGNGIYSQFDKTLVLDSGKQIYYGPIKDARPFMEDQGFECVDGANVADFLTGVTVPTERKLRPGYENKCPRTAEALHAAYKETSVHTQMISEYDYPNTDLARERTEAFKQGIALEKSKQLPKTSILTVDFVTQVKRCIVRQYQIIWGSLSTFLIKQISSLVQAIVAGSLFYNAADTSEGMFIKEGALYFSTLYHTMMAMSEVTDSFTGRPVLIKHKDFAFFHPAAFCLAQIAADIPVILFQITVFGIVLYFMVGLTMTAQAFFTYWVVLIASTMCMTAFFRAIGAAFSNFDAASKVSGFLMSTCAMYSGYMIHKEQMKPWWGWLYWLNPLSYAFESLLTSEFYGKTIDCVGSSLAPNGAGYEDTTHHACMGVGGAAKGADDVTGMEFIAYLSYSHTHLWLNFAILWAWWLLYVIVTVVCTSRWKSVAEDGASLLVPREKAKVRAHYAADVEAQVQEKDRSTRGEAYSSGEDTAGQPDNGAGGGDEGLVRNTSVFTWNNLSYVVKTPSGDRKLLDDVKGWVKPGMLGALMGSSGAGKTTLLDVLAGRKTDGTIHGSIMVDGRDLPVSFQRSAGYCEQLDVHEPYATVREALEFSALLRQGREVPDKEKLAYVQVIIDLLELNDLAETLIGRTGNGLSVEQRKRVTIGVELVSKPSILIFLDEPTSGLDGQSAFNTVRFLRKLADLGQAVLVTIHQPSAQLFAQFDTLLLLAKGGKTVYFGDIGDNAQVIKDYFARYGAPCPKDANPAEHMIDVVSGHLSQGRDWNEVWLSAPESKAVEEELNHIIDHAASNPAGSHDDGHEFAAPLLSQIRLVTHRNNISLWRNTDYVNNKFILHIALALFNGLSFFMIGPTVSDLQLWLFTVFNFIFVAPGVLAQLQPLFIERRNIFEAREKKSKMYSWIAFTCGLIISELPYLCVCGVLYYVCWYYLIGAPTGSNRAGATFFVMLMYEFVYTGIGQSIAAYAPNAVFATLANPTLIGTLILFCGVLVPYAEIQPFWRYWLYYLNPFDYLMGGMLVFVMWGQPVRCNPSELAVFDPPANETCYDFLAEYLTNSYGEAVNLLNPDATSGCEVCPYKTGSDYLRTLNLETYTFGWRNAGIVVIYVFSSYGLVFLLMKLRTKRSKKAE